MNKVVWRGIWIFLSIVVLVMLTIVILLIIGGGDIKDLEDEKDEKEEYTEEELDYMEYEEDMKEHFKSMELTEEEKGTIVSQYETEFVDPNEQDKMLYVFYDRTKPKSKELIEIVENYMEENDYPLTLYAMDTEEGIIQGQEVLKELGIDYEYSNQNSVNLVQLNNGVIVREMTPRTLSDDLVGDN